MDHTKKFIPFYTSKNIVKIQHTVQPHWGKVWPFLFKLPNDTEILILGKHPREMKACVHSRLTLTMS